MYIYLYLYMYTYIYTQHTYLCIYVYVYIYIGIYIVPEQSDFFHSGSLVAAGYVQPLYVMCIGRAQG